MILSHRLCFIFFLLLFFLSINCELLKFEIVENNIKKAYARFSENGLFIQHFMKLLIFTMFQCSPLRYLLGFHDRIFFFISGKNPKDLDINMFLKEALIMKDFQHRHVMRLVGICLGNDQLPLVILPFMQRGDLLSYLRDPKNVIAFKI